MAKIGVNDPCPCSSGKKYKKCCQSKSFDEKKKKIEENEKLQQIYINGQEDHSSKINYCIDYYKNLFPDHNLIDLSNYINTTNYKNILTLHYHNNTIILVERNELTQELFNEKSNLNKNDLLFIYKGGYKTFEAIDILHYDKDVKNMILNRDNGLTL